jgi:hypothetical protein
MAVEEFDQLGEVSKRTGQAVDLENYDHIDPASTDLVQKLPERRPIHRAAGVAAIVIASADQLPALVSLAPDIIVVFLREVDPLRD